MAIGLYRGFSSYGYQTTKRFGVSDINLVKRDLLNHIYTRRGERVMMPTFGTRIPDLAFEPLDKMTLDVLEEDLRSVVSYDPRVQLLDLKVIPSYDENYAIASILLLYIELDMTGNIDLNIQFDGVR
jgi:phage baseplate assembly protein W